MFLPLSVILFTGEGVSVQRVSLSREVFVQGGLCPGGSVSRGSVSRGSLCPGCLYLGVSFQKGVSVQRGTSVQRRGISVRETPLIPQRSGGTHPTGMHSCSYLIWFSFGFQE